MNFFFLGAGVGLVYIYALWESGLSREQMSREKQNVVSSVVWGTWIGISSNWNSDTIPTYKGIDVD